uniref:Uncharacterized protein n=1 Tax=Arundo donax TaxID=35708 RepID=A0A0A8ZP25_ARUDO
MIANSTTFDNYQNGNSGTTICTRVAQCYTSDPSARYLSSGRKFLFSLMP